MKLEPGELVFIVQGGTVYPAEVVETCSSGVFVNCADGPTNWTGDEPFGVPWRWILVPAMRIREFDREAAKRVPFDEDVFYAMPRVGDESKGGDDE